MLVGSLRHLRSVCAGTCMRVSVRVRVCVCVRTHTRVMRLCVCVRLCDASVQ